MAENFQYGYKQIAQYIKLHYNEYEKIVIDPRFGDYSMYSGIPTLYIPYYTKLDGQKLLQMKNVGNKQLFDKYEIGDINWNLEEKKSGYLYIVPNSNSPTNETGSA